MISNGPLYRLISPLATERHPAGIQVPRNPRKPTQCHFTNVDALMVSCTLSVGVSETRRVAKLCAVGGGVLRDPLHDHRNVVRVDLAGEFADLPLPLRELA